MLNRMQRNEHGFIFLVVMAIMLAVGISAISVMEMTTLEERSAGSEQQLIRVEQIAVSEVENQYRAIQADTTSLDSLTADQTRTVLFTGEDCSSPSATAEVCQSVILKYLGATNAGVKSFRIVSEAKSLVNGASWSNSITFNHGTPSCGTNQTLNSNDLCECNSGYEWVGTDCLAECGANEARSGQSCVCSSGYERVGTACLAPCGANSTRSGQSCVCNSGYQLLGGVCLLNCGANAHRSGQNCVCDSGYERVGTACLVACGVNEVRSGSSCVCSSHLARQGASCGCPTGQTPTHMASNGYIGGCQWNCSQNQYPITNPNGTTTCQACAPNMIYSWSAKACYCSQQTDYYGNCRRVEKIRVRRSGSSNTEFRFAYRFPSDYSDRDVLHGYGHGDVVWNIPIGAQTVNVYSGFCLFWLGSICTNYQWMARSINLAIDIHSPSKNAVCVDIHHDNHGWGNHTYYTANRGACSVP